MTVEKERIRLQFLCVYMIFAVVSLVMTLINALTGWKTLMLLTLVFGGLNVINFVLACFFPRTEHIVRGVFATELVCLLTSFLIIGDPEGFSAIWIALLPAAGLLLFRKRDGIILSVVMFAILAFLFWTPFGKSLLQFDYTETFLFRFPILYLAFFVLGFFFEWIRSVTQEELNISRNKYIKLSYTDRLTGLGNESSYLRKIEQIERKSKTAPIRFAVVFLDVNGVKMTNDQYGHRYGCHLIVTTGQTLPSIFPTSDLYHIGGDEFVAIVKGEDLTYLNDRLLALDAALRYREIVYDGKELILSVAHGVSIYREGEKYSTVVQRADEDMYQNKRAIKMQYGLPIRR